MEWKLITQLCAEYNAHVFGVLLTMVILLSKVLYGQKAINVGLAKDITAVDKRVDDVEQDVKKAEKSLGKIGEDVRKIEITTNELNLQMNYLIEEKGNGRQEEKKEACYR